LNVTPSAWGSLSKSIQIGNKSSLFSFNNGTTDLGFNVFWNSTNTDYNYIENGFVSLYRQSSGQHIWLNAPSGTAGDAISFTQAMTLDASGQLLIGTSTSSTFKLDVNGTARISGILSATALQTRTIDGSYAWLLKDTSDNNKWEIGHYNNDLYFYSYGSSSIPFIINDVTGAATFSSSVTATRGIFSGSTGETLTAQGVAGEWTTHITGSASTGNSYGLVVNAGTNASDLALGVYNQAFNSTLFTIKGDGAATFGSSVTTGGDLTVANTTSLLTLAASDAGVFQGIEFRQLGNLDASIKQLPATAEFRISNGRSAGWGGFTTFYTDTVERMRITDAGGVRLQQGLSLNSATAPASGIEFPATQVASASANNLDDYEEGTWTMGVSFGNGTTGITYSSNTGTYVKIGKQVTVTGYVEMTNKGSSTGTARITGLPFTVAAATANYSAPSFWTDAITFTVSLQGYGNVSDTTIDMLQVSALGIGSALTDTNFANNSRFMVTLTYFV